MENKASAALDWLKSAREKFRELAGGGETVPSARPKVGLALAGGFARGIAHLGVLKVLREAGIPVDCVAGTSVGALIATGFCAGTPLEAMEATALQTSFTDFGRWTPSWLGLATNQRMEKYVARLTAARTFEELQVPLAISTTDINAGMTVYYSSGPILPALRASCAYPGLFVPIQYDGRTLVDGFLTAPVPIEGALLLGADVVIAIYLESGGIENPRTAVDIISRSFNIIQGHSEIAWRQQADVVIEPEVKSFAWDNFARTPDLIEAGKEATLKMMPEILALVRGEKKSSTA